MREKPPNMMKVKAAYDEWASTYDLDENATRDLDINVSRQMLGDLHSRHILEIGCGTGKNTNFLTQIAAKVTAIDFSRSMLRKARAKVKAKNVNFCIANLTINWPFPCQEFDLVVGNLVLEHIEDLGFIFAEAARVLDEQGRLFISELHPFRQYLGQKASFQGKEGKLEIEAYLHHTSDYLSAAQSNGLQLQQLSEWSREKDVGKPPRLVSFVFRKVNGDLPDQLG